MAPKHVVIVGAGGNIGSHLTSHVARMAEVGRVTLIDPDLYERRNLASQDIVRADVGEQKVVVQARRIRRIAGRHLDVVTIAAGVEAVPAGRLRSEAILACLDSRAARQHVNELAWKLGIPWIDAGVEPSAWLARVNVYVPSRLSPCLECAWSDGDYEALEQRHPCDAVAEADDAPDLGHLRRRSPPRLQRWATRPTAAASPLGALAASLQAIECRKLLRGELDDAAIGRQVLVDAASHKHYVTSFRYRSSCRLRPHHPLTITPLAQGPTGMTVQGLFDRAGGDGLDRASLSISVAGMRLATQITCANAACARTYDAWRFSRGWLDGEERCDACGRRVIARGFDLVERLTRAHVMTSRTVSARTLGQLGLRSGDLCTLADAVAERHYLLGDDPV